MHDTVYCTVFNVLALNNCTGHHDAKVGRVRVGGHSFMPVCQFQHTLLQNTT